MATGKELVRLVTCPLWKETFEDMITWYQIFDNDGNPISLLEARSSTSCHLRVILRKNIIQNVEEKSQKLFINLTKDFMKAVASTASEHMTGNVNEDYGFTEIVIS